MRKGIENSCRALLCLAVAGSMAVCVSGCRESDALKERILDQTCDNVDYDNPQKQYINVPNAAITSEEFPQLEESKDASIERERKNENAVKGEDKVDDKVDEEKSKNNKEKNSDSKKKNKGKKGKKKSGKGGDSADSKTKGKGDTESGGKGGKGKAVDLSGSEEPKQDAYDKVVAFGETANIVMMLAGKGALVGSDKEFLNNEFVQEAYKDADIDKVATVKTDSTDIDVDDVIKAKPDALFLASETYELSEAQEKKLKKADIDVVYLPNLKSHSSIKSLVKSVGTMFGNGKQTLSGADAKGKAQDYCDWVGEEVKTYTKKNGGLTTYGGVNYDTGKVDTSKAVSGDSSKINWTLYVNQYDFEASYDASPNKKHLWTAEGVAIAKTGYKWSPLSYYMSVGGVNNNAAQFHVTKSTPTSLYYIWQFHLSYMPANTKDFEGATITTSKLENFADNDVLVRTQDGSRSGDGGSYSLGCDNFRYVITSTQKIQTAMTKSRDKGTESQEGLYAAYDYQNDHGQTGIGLFASQNILVPSYIGFVNGIKGTANTEKSVAYERYQSGENPYEVVTNPHGLYSAWADGSVESALECSWIYDLYHSDGDFSNCEKAVKEFYKTFYGYELSDDQVAAILAGLEK